MFTVLSLNLNGRSHQWLNRRPLIIGELLERQPDFVSLQEIHFPSGQAYWLARQLNARLGQNSYQVVLQRRKHLIQRFFDGVGLLTRLPVITQDAISLGFEGRVALVCNMELHTGDTLDFVTTQFHPIQTQPEARYQQALRLMGWLSERGRDANQVIAGDFQEGPQGQAVQHIKALYRSAFVVANGYEPLATYPTAMHSQPEREALCLDYIFISPTIGVRQVETCLKTPDSQNPDIFPSTHVGLWAELEIKRA